MARYFFNVIDGKFLVDEEGYELPDMAAVREMAIHTAGSMLREEGKNIVSGEHWEMHVSNEAKEIVYRLTFAAEEPILQEQSAPAAGP